MTIAARVARIAATAVAMGGALLLAFAFAPTLVGARSLIVTSGSMEPAMPTGSVAITRAVDVRAVGVSDIISYRAPGADRPTTHRVVEVTDVEGARAFITQGDANATPDPDPVVVKGTIERVERVVPFAGAIVAFARSPIGLLVLFVIPIVGLAVEHVRRRPAVEQVCPSCGAHEVERAA